MSLIAKDTSSGGDFEPVPAGMHQGVCYAIIDIGTQPQFGNFPSRRKVMFLWELPTERGDFTQDGKKVNLPRAISARYTLSLASKGNLRPMLESWRGRQFTPAELEGFDIANVLGANCYLNVVHANGKGEKASRVYANVASVNPIPKNVVKLKPENPTIVFSMDDFKGPVVIPVSIPEWITGLIVQSDEYNAKQKESANPHRPTADELANVTPEDDFTDVPF